MVFRPWLLFFTGFAIAVLDARCLKKIAKHCSKWKDQGYCDSKEHLIAVVMTTACQSVCSNTSGTTGVQEDESKPQKDWAPPPPYQLLKQGISPRTGAPNQVNSPNGSIISPAMVLKHGVTVYAPPEADSTSKALCQKSLHGCCHDNKTPADGPKNQGCAMKLCVDLKVCGKYKDDKSEKGCATKDPNRQKWHRDHCPYTCGLCKKALSPQQKCEATSPQWGCCWNGDPATGPNNKGCPACNDQSEHVCRQWKNNCHSSPFYTTRLFMQQHCPKTCGRCGCRDSYDKCDRWKHDGFCHARHSWRNFMRTHCRATCGFCAGKS